MAMILWLRNFSDLSIRTYVQLSRSFYHLAIKGAKGKWIPAAVREATNLEAALH